jgi:hypothetical protein
LTIAIGDTVRVVEGANHPEVKAGAIGKVHHLGVKYPGDIRVKFPKDPDLLWLYPEHYERMEENTEH